MTAEPGETSPPNPYDQLIAQLQGADQVVSDAEAMIEDILAAPQAKIDAAEAAITAARREQGDIYERADELRRAQARNRRDLIFDRPAWAPPYVVGIIGLDKNYPGSQEPVDLEVAINKAKALNELDQSTREGAGGVRNVPFLAAVGQKLRLGIFDILDNKSLFDLHKFETGAVGLAFHNAEIIELDPETTCFGFTIFTDERIAQEPTAFEVSEIEAARAEDQTMPKLVLGKDRVIQYLQAVEQQRTVDPEATPAHSEAANFSLAIALHMNGAVETSDLRTAELPLERWRALLEDRAVRLAVDYAESTLSAGKAEAEQKVAADLSFVYAAWEMFTPNLAARNRLKQRADELLAEDWQNTTNPQRGENLRDIAERFITQTFLVIA